MTSNIIEGINVLKMTAITYQDCTLFYILLALGALIAIISGCVIPFKYGIYDNYIASQRKKLKYCCIIGFILGCVIMLCSVIPFPGTVHKTGRYTYECTIDDTVSAKYISDTLIILEVTDSVWTIQDKEDN